MRTFLGVALLAAAAPLAVSVAPPAVVELHGLRSDSPVPLSAPEEAGLDAVRAVHPPDAKAGGEKLAVTAVAFPKDSGMSDAELVDYVKTTFLATSAQGRKVVRSFLGREVTGQGLEKKVPAPSLAEVYVVTKEKGDKVVLAFVFAPLFAKEAESAISAIAATMKE